MWFSTYEVKYKYHIGVMGEKEWQKRKCGKNIKKTGNAGMTRDCEKKQERITIFYGQGIVKSRGGFTSKIHTATDENGKAMCVFITGGNIYDSTQAEKLLHDTIHEGVHVLGDKAFDSK